MAIDIASEQQVAERVQQLQERLIQATNATFDIYTIHIGDQLGFYRALAESPGVTVPELAAATSTNERYVREWLEYQAMSKLLDVDLPAADANQRRYRLPEAAEHVLVEQDNLNYAAPIAQMMVGTVAPVDAVIGAFKAGGGVPYEEYGRDMREGISRMNRNLFVHQLGQEFFPQIEDLHRRLTAAPPARIADVGCGMGLSSVGMASAYPLVRVDGFDLDAESVAEAQGVIGDAGLQARVTVSQRDAASPELAGRYDLVTAFQCVHDMSDPVGALTTMRRLAGDDGIVLVVDERVAETFDPDGGPIEQMMYGFSVMHCLPVGMADAPSAATGTVMRPQTLRRYAVEAGFRDVEILPLEHPFFYFYRLWQ